MMDGFSNAIGVIHKNHDTQHGFHAMRSYENAYADFNWKDARSVLGNLSHGKLINIAYQSVDRFVDAGGGTKTAVRFINSKGGVHDVSYSDLAQNSNRFANVLAEHHVKAGETIFTLLGRVPQLFITALGTLKAKSIFCPLFSAFGPEPIHMRMTIGDARVLVTSRRLYERKIKPIRDRMPRLAYIFLVDDDDHSMNYPGTENFDAIVSRASTDFNIPPTNPEDPAIIHFTSGTTGTPKGALHVHDAILCHKATARNVLDLRPNDIFWCTADPGWVTGTSYGIFGPLANDVTMIADEGEFDPERWYSIIDKQNVTVLYTAPTAIRMLMRAGDDLPKRFDLSSLRHIASVGEPLNPEAVLWGQRVLGLPIHDNWWQTETGGIMIANFPTMSIKPGSMGRPVPGITAGIIERTKQGLSVIDTPNIDGELAIKVPWPSMFRNYLGQDERYRNCFLDGWYLTGDLARRDVDGYFWFIGRADDVIKSSGHLIGPFEVESSLMEHSAVAEAAVIGVPDPLLGESVKAFVSLKDNQKPSDDLKKNILSFIRIRLGPAIAPREISFIESIPKTRSGKIMRRLLKARELGLPLGDLSTLESSSQDIALGPNP